MIPPFLLLSAAETRAVEAAAMSNGLSGAAMMEAAGAAVVSFIARSVSKRPAAILCGPGANGGDGFVVARLLKELGFPVRVGLLGEASQLKGDAALMAKLFDGAVEPLSPAILDGAGIIVDALFGTGLARAIEGAARETVIAANAHAAPVFAVDIPSGVDADAGAVLGVAIEAAATIAFIAKKPGHLLFPGRALSGAVTVADIGVQDEWVASVKPSAFENHPALWAARWRRPSFLTHKYDRGHAAIVSGPRLKTGAARLAATAALRSGAGLVTMLSPKDACDENAAHLTAIMLREADGADAIASIVADRRFTATLIGPAAGVGPQTKGRALAILRSPAGAVLDADALTSFEGDAGTLFAALREDDVLTPHEGEFARLFPGLKGQGKLAAARAAAARAKAVIVLKGADTIIAAPDARAVINANAPFDLATAGSGDVLAGIIAGMRAQGLPGFEAAAAGVFLHGAAGQIAGPGLVAEDLADALRKVLRTLFAPPAQQTGEPGEKP
ncbi:MAG: NAD(P)H-hydrate dehydratase [Pseudomonadota bacterium]